MKAKLSIYLTALVVAGFFILAIYFTTWWLIPYVILGIIYERLAKIQWRLPIMGDVLFGVFWVVFLVCAALLCWTKPYRGLNILQILPYTLDLFAHHYDGKYQYDHGHIAPTAHDNPSK